MNTLVAKRPCNDVSAMVKPAARVTAKTQQVWREASHYQELSESEVEQIQGWDRLLALVLAFAAPGARYRML